MTEWDDLKKSPPKKLPRFSKIRKEIKVIVIRDPKKEQVKSKKTNAIPPRPQKLVRRLPRRPRTRAAPLLRHLVSAPFQAPPPQTKSRSLMASFEINSHGTNHFFLLIVSTTVVFLCFAA